MLVSCLYEVESEQNLRCQASRQQPIYFDEIHRYGRYVVGGAPPGIVDVSTRPTRMGMLFWVVGGIILLVALGRAF
jgi:hypothetical protein